MPGFVDGAARAAFKDAIESVERASAAEIVVSVRRQSAAWTHAYLLVGIAAAIAAHAYMLFSTHPFATTGLFTGPILAGALAGGASTLVLGVPRWLTPPSRRRAAVRRAARAVFVERGIARTRARSGILVYISIVERMAELVADDGVATAIPAGEWEKLCAAVDAAVAHGGVATARALAALGPPLGRVLPCAADDVNELPDELDGDGA